MKSPKKIKNVLICGNYGINNLGDEAILAGLLKLINSTWPGVKITAMSSDQAFTKRSHNVSSVSLFPTGIRSSFKFWFSPDFVKTFRALNKSDIVFLGGGGLFNDQKWQSVIIWFIQFLWIWITRKPMVCIAQSVGPLKSAWSRFLVKLVFKYAKLVTVRDSASAKLLSSVDIKNVHVLSDPAFAIGYESAKSRKKQNQMIISIRPWQSHNASRVYKEIAQTIDFVFEHLEIQSIFIPFQTQIENDGDSFKAIHKLLNNKQALNYELPEDYLHALEIIGRSRMVIGMRLHSNIFSTLAATPFIALSYSNKVKGYVESIEMDEFLYDSNSFSAEQLNKSIKKVVSEPSIIEKHLEKEKLQKTYTFFEHEKLLKSTFNTDH